MFKYIIPLIAFAFFSCEVEEKPVDIKKEIIGSWELEQYVDHSKGETGFESYGDSILYQKHITAYHFTWFKYDRKNEMILGMGGGSYRVIDGKYVENIEFFYPPGSNELGQAIPFDVAFKQGKWYHTGFAKVIETDLETGKLIPMDSSKIEEIWIKTPLHANEPNILMGSWDLTAKRDSLTGSYFEYPEFMGYMKLITATHFIWINYDRYGDEIFGAGSGPYTFTDGIYAENIKMIFPRNTGQLDALVTFRADPYQNQWNHFGYVPEITIDASNGNIIKDSTLVDEIWKPHKPDISEDISF